MHFEPALDAVLPGDFADDDGGWVGRGGCGGAGDGAGDKPIGVTTSGGYGHYTGRSLGFAFVDTAFAAAGTPLTVELLGEMRAATVTADAVWDPNNDRLRG